MAEAVGSDPTISIRVLEFTIDGKEKGTPYHLEVRNVDKVDVYDLREDQVYTFTLHDSTKDVEFFLKEKKLFSEKMRLNMKMDMLSMPQGVEQPCEASVTKGNQNIYLRLLVKAQNFGIPRHENLYPEEPGKDTVMAEQRTVLDAYQPAASSASSNAPQNAENRSFTAPTDGPRQSPPLYAQPPPQPSYQPTVPYPPAAPYAQPYVPGPQQQFQAPQAGMPPQPPFQGQYQQQAAPQHLYQQVPPPVQYHAHHHQHQHQHHHHHYQPHHYQPQYQQPMPANAFPGYPMHPPPQQGYMPPGPPYSQTQYNPPGHPQPYPMPPHGQVAGGPPPQQLQPQLLQPQQPGPAVGQPHMSQPQGQQRPPPHQPPASQPAPAPVPPPPQQYMVPPSAPPAVPVMAAAANPPAGLPPQRSANAPSSKRYEVVRSLGAGGQGGVWLINLLQTGQAYTTPQANQASGEPAALKMIPCVSLDHANMAMEEAKFLIKFDHPHIVGYKDFWLEQDGPKFNVCIAMQYCPNGDLMKYVEVNGKPTSQVAGKWAFEIADALAYLHQRNIIHRDLKPANVLLDDAMHCRLADLGLLRRISHADENIQTQVGTPMYLAPEVMLQQNYDAKVDIWALGCMLYTLTTGKLRNINFEICAHSNAPSYYLEELQWEMSEKGYSQPLVALVGKCLSLSANNRPTAQAVMAEVQAGGLV